MRADEGVASSIFFAHESVRESQQEMIVDGISALKRSVSYWLRHLLELERLRPHWLPRLRFQKILTIFCMNQKLSS